jgi:hypothetical protein
MHEIQILLNQTFLIVFDQTNPRTPSAIKNTGAMKLIYGIPDFPICSLISSIPLSLIPDYGSIAVFNTISTIIKLLR